VFKSGKAFKGTALLAVLVLLSGLLAGCGGGKTSGGEQAGVPEKTWQLKAGHVAAAGHPMDEALKDMAKKLEQSTNGRVKMDVFAASALGGERELIEGARLGTVDVVLATTAVTANFVPGMKVFDLPFLIRDRDHAYKVLDGEIGRDLLNRMTEHNLIGLSFWENGFRQMTNSKRPINSPADVKGIKLRTMENPIHMDAWRALGADPTPMAFAEVFTALQQGTVDGQENPLAIIATSRLFEVQKYLALTNHNYSPMVLMVSKSVWETFPEDIKQLFRQFAMEGAADEREALHKANAQYLEQIKAAGVQVTEPDTTPFQEAIKAVYDKYGDQIGKDLIDRIINTR